MADFTRKLSAAIYTNSGLRNFLLKSIYNKHQTIPPSTSFNTNLLIGHTYRARTMAFKRALIIACYIPSTIIVCILLAFTFNSYFAILVYAILITTLFLTLNLWQDYYLRQNFSSGTFNPKPEFSKKNKEWSKDSSTRICKNVFYYSGFSPFIGFGRQVGGWSFAINIDNSDFKKVKKTAPINFTVTELYNSIKEGLLKLDMEDLSINGIVFCDGRKIRKDRRFLKKITGHPECFLTNDTIEEIIESNNKYARHYLAIQVDDWGGNVQLTSFLRLHKTNMTLFIENTYCIIAQVKDQYKDIDEHSIGISYISTELVKAMAHAIAHPIAYFISLGNIVNWVFDSYIMIRVFFRRWMVKEDPSFNYGNKHSIREFVSDPSYGTHYQKADKDRYLKTIEKRIFSTISKFLENKKINSSELKRRENNIINNGIIITGGNVTSENIAAGNRSRITRIKNKLAQSSKPIQK